MPSHQLFPCFALEHIKCNLCVEQLDFKFYYSHRQLQLPFWMVKPRTVITSSCSSQVPQLQPVTSINTVLGILAGQSLCIRNVCYTHISTPTKLVAHMLSHHTHSTSSFFITTVHGELSGVALIALHHSFQLPHSVHSMDVPGVYSARPPVKRIRLFLNKATRAISDLLPCA